MGVSTTNTVDLDVAESGAYCDVDMSSRDYRLAAILFSDIAGFSRLVQQDEEAAITLLAEYTSIVKTVVESHNGRLVRSVGETCLCELPNSVHAVKAGVEIQDALAEHNRSNRQRPLGVRVGVHVGDIYFVEGDAFGEGVTVAGRVQQSAHPGRVVISQDVQSLVSGKIELKMKPAGTLKVRGIDRAVPTFEIAVSPDAEHVPPGWEAEVVTESAGTAEAQGPGEGTSSRAGTRSGNAPASDTIYEEIKPLVLDAIKQAGRRLSVREARARIGRVGTEVDRALEKLATKGFLVRSERSSSRGSSRSPSASESGRGAVEIAMPGQNTFVDELDGKDKWDEHRWHHDDKRAMQEDSRWERALSEQGPAPGAYDPLVEDYKDYAAHTAEKEKTNFRSHLISYLGVNGGLFALWALTSGFGGFPWFIIVALGWGIGIASHFTHVRQKTRESEELDGAEGLTREQLRVYRKLSRARGAWWGHLVSNVATSGLLLAINLMTSPGFFWALFPIGFMAIGVLSHLPAFKAKENRLLARLKQLGAKIGGRFRRRGPRHVTETAPASQLTGASAEAENVRRRLEKYIESMPESSPLGEDFLPVLESYVDQIKLLDQKSREIEQIVSGIPVAELERDLSNLRHERELAGAEKVVSEYDNSIRQIEKQRSSYSELKNEQQILKLRLNSGLNQLRQMEIDVARMRNLSSDEELASVRMLREKAGELNSYLGDLQAGYRELEDES
jgi:class 3 adenylate cyclase